MLLQELAKATQTSTNDQSGVCVASLAKPVAARLADHKQKRRVLELDDSYTGPYCEGIPLPQLLLKVSNCYSPLTPLQVLYSLTNIQHLTWQLVCLISQACIHQPSLTSDRLTMMQMTLHHYLGRVMQCTSNMQRYFSSMYLSCLM